MRIIYQESGVIAPSGTLTLPDITIPQGGNLVLIVGNLDAAHDDMTVSSFLKSALGFTGDTDDPNLYFNDTSLVAYFGTIQHGIANAKGYEITGVAYQQARVTLASTLGISRAQIDLCSIRQAP